MRLAIREALETIALAVFLVLVLQSTVQNYRVEGPSMDPRLENQDRVLVNKVLFMEIDAIKADLNGILMATSGLEPVPKKIVITDQVLHILSDIPGGARVVDVAAHMGTPGRDGQKRAQNALRTLLRQGRVRRTGRGRYEIAQTENGGGEP